MNIEKVEGSFEYLKQQLLISQTQNLELKHHIEALEQKYNQINDLLVRDQLTGLQSRKYLVDYLETLKNCGQHTCIAVVNLDHFCHINQTFTYPIGDEVLKRISFILSKYVRKTDIIARDSGDAFIILLPQTDIQQSLSACERFRCNIQYYNWQDIHPNLKITLSIGLASGKDDDLDHLIHKALEKLVIAKKMGRNCVKY